MARTIIVGGVAGGMSAAARLRRNDENHEIIVFEKGEYISFANCGLPYYIGGSINDREKLLVQTVEGFSARFHVDIRTKSEVMAIDPKEKTVAVKNHVSGETYQQKYDKLVLSPGAEAIRPQLSGSDHPRIFTLRNIPDTDRIKNFIDTNSPKRAVIIGAGFIGLEMAENLHERGIMVSVIEMVDQILNVIDYEMAAMVHRELKQKHIELYLKETVSAFEDVSGKVKIKMQSGKEIVADMVVLSIGVRAESHLAKNAGLKMGQRGISVNEFMQTSDPDIYAVGDVVECIHPITGKPMLIPLAGPANKQGRIAADNIAFGNKSRYNGTMGTSIVKVFDTTIGVTGATEKLLKMEKIPCHAIIIHPNQHAGYYPGATLFTLKLLFSPQGGKILGTSGGRYRRCG